MYGNNVPKPPKLNGVVPPTPRMSLYKPSEMNKEPVINK